MNQNDLEKIEKITEEFFKKMTIEVKIEVGRPKENTIPINLKTEEPQILIGEKGQTLTEIQHLLKIILKKKINEDFFIDLDIQDYKKKKIEYLKEMARSLAEEVALTKKEKELLPMSPYERRIIHLELGGHPDVKTESIGEGPERRIIIKPRF